MHGDCQWQNCKNLPIIVYFTAVHTMSLFNYRWMYWTDVGTDTIERATMDGNDRTTLHSTGLSSVYGLTLDYQNQTLYWVDLSSNRIESSSVDGSNRQTLTSSLRDPWAVTFYGGVLYWTDVTLYRIYSFSVSTSSAPIIQLTSYLGSVPRDIRVVSQERQPLGV